MLRFHGTTDIGRRRTLNEDAIFVENGLFVVCDGMGGHKAGEVASRLAVDAIVSFIRRSEEDLELTWPFGFDPRATYNANRLRTAISLANRLVSRKAMSSDDYSGMGTTVAATLITADRGEMTYANVGDSRIYVLTGSAMRQLTTDDSLVNLLPGDDTSAMKNVLTKALGARESVEFEVLKHQLEPGDIALLCSDGLTNMLADDVILEVVRNGRDLDASCAELVARANAMGGRDNISVVLVQFTR